LVFTAIPAATAVEPASTRQIAAPGQRAKLRVI